jgi:hypothetical protein
MLPFARPCIRQSTRILASATSILHVRPRLAQTPLVSLQSIRHKGGKRKKKNKAGGGQQETRAERLFRAKTKLKKTLELKRKRHDKLLAAQKAVFRLPPHEPRPDAIPFGTAMFLLRGLAAKQQLFVRSRAASWTGETKVVAALRVVPNDHHPRGVKGRVKFPNPVVSASKEGKKERIAAIVEGDQAEAAKKAGMIVGGKDYLDKVTARAAID